MSKRILVVEPSRTIRSLLSTYFGNAHHQVVACTTPTEALQIFKNLDSAAVPVPDIIFLAVDQQKGAYGVIQYALSHTKYKDCVFVALVSEEEKKTIQQVLKHIPLTVHYLVKPFHIQDALALVSVPVAREERV